MLWGRWGRVRRAYFFGLFFWGTFSLFFLGKQHVAYVLDGFRAISLGFCKKTFIQTLFPSFLEANETQERRKEGRIKETRKEEGRKEGSATA